VVDALILSGLDYQVVPQPHQAAKRANLLIGTGRWDSEPILSKTRSPLSVAGGGDGSLLDQGSRSGVRKNGSCLAWKGNRLRGNIFQLDTGHSIGKARQFRTEPAHEAAHSCNIRLSQF
jgi:hypothetical protein